MSYVKCQSRACMGAGEPEPAPINNRREPAPRCAGAGDASTRGSPPDQNTRLHHILILIDYDTCI